MSRNFRWSKFEGSRSFLQEEDKIYYWEFYDPVYLMGYTPASSLICNLKKTPDDPHYQYRQKSLREASEILECFLERTNLSAITIVPIPRSNCVGSYDYNSLLAEILEGSSCSPDIQNLFCFKQLNEKTHYSSGRRDSQLIQANLSINEERLSICKTKIVLFDDVLTTGAHFAACKNLILSCRSEVTAYGLMLTVTR